MKLLWNDEEFSSLQKENLSDEQLLKLIKITLFGKLEYEKLFKIYDYILGDFESKRFLNEEHSREEIYNYLKTLEV